MKTTLKILLLILSISLVNCKKPNSFYEVELENEPAIVREITDFLDDDGLFYLELVNKHAKLRYTNLNLSGYGYPDEFSEKHQKEGLAVKISGVVVVSKHNWDLSINNIYFHTFYLSSIEAYE